MLFVLFLGAAGVCAAAADADDFAQGTLAYEARNFEKAAADFGRAAERAPSVGTWQNLGNAEWQRGQTGPAILAWERAQWLDPLDANARGNLRFARKARLLEAPDLVWYEICSTWLPVDAWAWIASASLWLAVAMVLLPNILRWRRASWQQALAAAGFAIFLLTLPAMVGIHTRAKIGVVLAADTPLRLTPTAEAQSLARLAAGETARLERRRGQYLFVRTGTSAGWIDRAQFNLIARTQ